MLPDRLKAPLCPTDLNTTRSHLTNISEQNHDAPKLRHAQEVLVLVFVANNQPPEVLKPREEPLDLPPPLVATQLASILALFLLSVLPMWSDHLDASLKESLVEWV